MPRRILFLYLLLSLCLTPLVMAQGAPAWQVGTSYAQGAAVVYNGTPYRCRQAHTAITGWEPPKIPGLWEAGTSPQAGSPAPSTPKPKAKPKTGRVFAPYVDMGLTNNDLRQIQSAAGVRYFTLGFVVAQGGCLPAWGGKAPVAQDSTFPGYIDAVRRAGGDVILAFGGYAGTDLAQACGDPASLQAAYQAVIDKYRATRLDFDMEAAALADPAAADRRDRALAALGKANPGLEISFTLPARPEGMAQPVLDVLRNAKSHGAPISLVNLMTMDYGYPVPENDMGPAAIAAADGARRQLQTLGWNLPLGITIMIGRNDTAGETFTLADARTLLDYIGAAPDIARLSLWSIQRDNGGCPGTLAPTCSGIAQQDGEFTRIFRIFENQALGVVSRNPRKFRHPNFKRAELSASIP